MAGNAVGRVQPRTGVQDATLRRVVGAEFIDGHYFELLECGHSGRIIGRKPAASKRWCSHCGSSRSSHGASE